MPPDPVAPCLHPAAAPRATKRTLPREQVRPGREQGQGGMRVLVGAWRFSNCLLLSVLPHPGQAARGLLRTRALPAAGVFLVTRRVLGSVLTPSMIADSVRMYNSKNRASSRGRAGIGN